MVDMQTFLGVLTQTIVSASVGAIVFVLVSFLLKSQEMISLKNSIKQKIFRKAAPPHDDIRESGGL